MRRRKATRAKAILAKEYHTMPSDYVAKPSARQDGGTKEAGRQHSHSGPMMDHVSGVIVTPGKTATFVWTFAGTTDLAFACDIPEHCQEGMCGLVTFVR